MKIEVIELPRLLQPHHLPGRAVVVFDVLRATTSITSALMAGVQEVRVFGSLAEAETAAKAFAGRRLLCGEQNCLMPPGFDLGNSPGQFVAKLHCGATAFLSTTNGTRAIVAAKSAPVMLAGCLLNAFAVAEALVAIGRDVTLLCSGTEGEVSIDDEIGAGAVVHRLMLLRRCDPSEGALAASSRFAAAMADLPAALAATQSGQNVTRAGLAADIAFAARLDVTDVVGEVKSDPLRVVRRGVEI